MHPDNSSSYACSPIEATGQPTRWRCARRAADVSNDRRHAGGYPGAGLREDGRRQCHSASPHRSRSRTRPDAQPPSRPMHSGGSCGKAPRSSATTRPPPLPAPDLVLGTARAPNAAGRSLRPELAGVLNDRAPSRASWLIRWPQHLETTAAAACRRYTRARVSLLLRPERRWLWQIQASQIDLCRSSDVSIAGPGGHPCAPRPC